MSLLHIKHVYRMLNPLTEANVKKCSAVRFARTYPSGAILPEPKRVRFGFVCVVFCLTIGLTIGSTISKGMANFLEENELFVPPDDDDDDD